MLERKEAFVLKYNNVLQKSNLEICDIIGHNLELHLYHHSFLQGK